MTFHLIYDNQRFLIAYFHCKGGATPGPQAGMALLGRQLYILRVNVPTMEDYQVFQSACNEELSCSQEPQIPRTEETRFAPCDS